MSHAVWLGALLVTAFGAGVVGAVLGLGGGILLVPLLTMVFGINLHYAMGASLVSVIATSSGAAAMYLRSGLSNIRVGLFLAMATVTGALIGAALSGIVPARALELILGLALAYSVVVTLPAAQGRAAGGAARRSLAMRFGLEGEYDDVRLGREVNYRADRVKVGVGGHVGRGRAVGPARHRQRGVQGAGPGLRHALAHEGLHRDEQLHDRHHRRRQRAASTSAGATSIRSSPRRWPWGSCWAPRSAPC